uniref:Uncharacterized protein n=1 Tax=Mus musculus TaxID=10090 RepID=Q3UXY3_MOUSE|nr:unnamed protein product [Mus musculus]
MTSPSLGVVFNVPPLVWGTFGLNYSLASLSTVFFSTSGIVSWSC